MTVNFAFRISGISAIIAGVLFALIQLVHPEDSLEAVASDRWMVAHTLTFFFPIFGMLGLTGLYIRQLEQSGYTGLIGYLGLFGAFVLMTCFAFYEAFITPVLIDEAPGYVADALSILDGEPGPKYLGTIYQINGALYLLGGVIFAFATLRAKVFPQWASAVMLLGLIATLGAAVAPTIARPSAVVFGIGLAALGYSLFSSNWADENRGESRSSELATGSQGSTTSA